jgi:hypothetical protein
MDACGQILKWCREAVEAKYLIAKERGMEDHVVILMRTDETRPDTPDDDGIASFQIVGIKLYVVPRAQAAAIFEDDRIPGMAQTIRDFPASDSEFTVIVCDMESGMITRLPIPS